jgi:hypothetical protein
MTPSPSAVQQSRRCRTCHVNQSIRSTRMRAGIPCNERIASPPADEPSANCVCAPVASPTKSSPNQIEPNQIRRSTPSSILSYSGLEKVSSSVRTTIARWRLEKDPTSGRRPSRQAYTPLGYLFWRRSSVRRTPVAGGALTDYWIECLKQITSGCPRSRTGTRQRMSIHQRLARGVMMVTSEPGFLGRRAARRLRR